MKVFCSNDRKKYLPEGYDEHIDIKCRSDVGFQFWDKHMKFDSEFSSLAIDLLYISIFVFAMDRKVLRAEQPDNWSRSIELNIPVSDVVFWDERKTLLHTMISFLSGDDWKFSFRKKEILDERDFYERNKYKNLIT